MAASRIDRVISLLAQAETLERHTPIQLDATDLSWLCTEATKKLKSDSILLTLSAPMTVLGDIHGQFYDLLKFFKLGGRPPTTSYLFLGDYVDRGHNSIETFAYLLALKIKYPKNVWLLRGNHETPDICRVYGFYDECSQRYTEKLWNEFVDVFQYLPLAAVISSRIFCVHGGLSQKLRYLSDIQKIEPVLLVPEEGLIADLLWADPSKSHNGFLESERGTAYTFGADAAHQFLDDNDLDLICRGHQVVAPGFEFPFESDQCVLTVFSAPDYCEEFGNRGAMLKVSPDLKCSFQFVDAPKTKAAAGRPATPTASPGVPRRPR
jgi:serine/threonine-protein phosphatase PP1 catalytic subunit